MSRARGWWRRALPFLIAGVAVLTLTAWHAGSILVVSRPLAMPDAIVTLASHEWERLPHAARLAAKYPAATVLLTLPPEPTMHNCNDCANRADRLTRAGVEAARIQVVPITLSGTYGEAVAILGYARSAAIRRLAIVTSPYHTRRSLATFRKVFAASGVDVEIGIEPASASSPARPSRWWWYGYDRAYVAYEWAALVYYAARYGVLAVSTATGDLTLYRSYAPTS